MKTLFLGLVSVLSAFACVSNARDLPLVPSEKAGLAATKLDKINRFMERQVADQKLAGGLVMISHAGQIGFFRTYGMQDREAQYWRCPLWY